MDRFRLLCAPVMMICGICGNNSKNVTEYIRHVSLVHRGDPHFDIICGVGQCPRTFRRYSSFTSHVYRKHNISMYNEHTDAHEDNGIFNTLDLVCIWCDTSLKISKCSQLVGHLGRHMEMGKEITCPVEMCGSSYTVLSSMTSHIARNHSNFNLEQVKTEYIDKTKQIQRSDCSTQASNEAELNMSSDNSSTCNDNVHETPESHSESLEDVEFEHTFLRTLSNSILKVQEFHHLPVSTVDLIVDEMHSVFSSSFDYTKQSVLRILHDHDIDKEVRSKIVSEFENNIWKSSFNMLGSAYKRQKFMTENYPYVKPVVVQLGRNKNHNMRHYQYVPILDTFKCMLQDEDVLASVMNFNESENSSVLVDYKDGSHYKNHPLFSSNRNALQVILYFDEFEVANPLGSRRGIHKLGAFYMTLGNLDPFQRSGLKSMQLCILCNVVDIKEYGINEIVQPLINDLQILESEGITVKGIKESIKGSLIYICADNLGSHQIGGFTESFSPKVKRQCRFCMASPQESQNTFDPTKLVLRDTETYKYHVEKITEDPSLCSLYGIKRDSAFNKLTYFHVSNGLPPDCMHDLLEGCARKEVPLVLQRLVQDGIITEKQIILRMENWVYGRTDATNKPTVPKSLTSFPESAIQMWTLLRFLPLIIGDIVPNGNKEWNTLLLLKDITEIALSPKISKQTCPYLQSLISEHHLLYKDCFPVENITPKHHFLTHYPEMILKFGPVRACWCMRFEGKHSYFKQLAIRLCNFKNLTSTLAMRHQTLQAYSMGSAKSFMETGFQSFHVPLCRPLPEMEWYVQLNATFQEKGMHLADFSCVNKITVNGVTYFKGNFVIIGFLHDELMLSKILYILVKMRLVIFVTRKHLAVYNPHFRAYETTPVATELSNSLEVVKLEDLQDLLPLEGYRKKNQVYVVLHHYIINTDNIHGE